MSVFMRNLQKSATDWAPRGRIRRKVSARKRTKQAEVRGKLMKINQSCAARMATRDHAVHTRKHKKREREVEVHWPERTRARERGSGQRCSVKTKLSKQTCAGHCGIGRFCFCFLASFILSAKRLMEPMAANQRLSKHNSEARVLEMRQTSLPIGTPRQTPMRPSCSVRRPECSGSGPRWDPPVKKII